MLRFVTKIKKKKRGAYIYVPAPIVRYLSLDKEYEILIKEYKS